MAGHAQRLPFCPHCRTHHDGTRCHQAPSTIGRTLGRSGALLAGALFGAAALAAGCAETSPLGGAVVQVAQIEPVADEPMYGVPPELMPVTARIAEVEEQADGTWEVELEEVDEDTGLYAGVVGTVDDTTIQIRVVECDPDACRGVAVDDEDGEELAEGDEVEFVVEAW